MGLNISLIVPSMNVKTSAEPIICYYERKYPSLGLGYIAASLKEAGYPLQYIDMNALELSNKKILPILEKNPPDLVGITINLFTLSTGRQIAHLIKKVYPKCFVVVGGPALGIYPKEILENKEFDAGIIGEGEFAIQALVKALEQNGSFSNIQGLVYKSNSEIIVNSPQPFIENLDTLPFPARELMPNDKYYSTIMQSRKFTTSTSSRGCSFRCIFCSEKNKWRGRSPRNVVDELVVIVNHFGIEEVHFCDSCFTFDLKRAQLICKEIIKRKLNFSWECQTRVDRVNLPLLRWMKAAGCNRIHYGLESGDSQILNLLNKRVKLDQIKRAVKWTHSAGIETVAAFMIGSPGETLNTIKRTINFAIHLDPDYVYFRIATPLPGTKFFDIAINEYGLNPQIWVDYIRGKIKEIPDFVFETPEYNKSNLENILKDAYRRFYFRPHIILKRLKKLKGFYSLLYNLKGLINLVRLYIGTF